MKNLVLNIYKGKQIEKTYTSDTADLMYGTIEDIISILDAVQSNDTDKIIDAITGCLKELKPMLMDIFDGLTEEELRRTKVSELVVVFVNIFKFSLLQMDFAGNNSKN